MSKKKEHHNSFSKKDYFDHLLTLTPSSVYWKDLDGVYLGCNLSMLDMVGFFSIKEIIGEKKEIIGRHRHWSIFNWFFDLLDPSFLEHRVTSNELVNKFRYVLKAFNE